TGWAPLVPFAVAGLVVAVHGLSARRGFGGGLLFGVAFMAALLPWLRVIGVDAWLALSLLEGLFYGLLGAATTRVVRLRAWPVWVACCWVGAELLRSLLPWGGFPWGRLAFATVGTPLAPSMAWVGTSGTSFLVALLGTTAAWLVLDRPGRRWSAAGVAVAVGVPLVLAVLPLGAPPAGAGPHVRVAAVQGNVPGEGMEAFAERRAVLDNHVNATLHFADQVRAGRTPKPAFVLWPENSTDIDPFTDYGVYADIQGAVDAVGVPVLVGAMVEGPGPHDIRNQGIVWKPGTGPAQTYSKIHPVPFGEYIPMRAELAHLFKRLDQIPRDMVPGTRPGVLDLAGTTIGDVICFEVAYDGVVQDVVDGGAQLLVVQTNNATYMGTGQVEQQFAIARLRAIETSRYVVVVATDGVSGIIAPDGSVVQRAPTRQPVVMDREVGLRTVLTPAVRLSRWIDWLLGLTGLAAVVVAVLLDRRDRGRRQPRPTDRTDGGPSPVPTTRDPAWTAS
ncbi:MAG: apolipoprotein N-acyltransferase, partial [Nocardioidaceae bacterium]|nr:apolipoprotein N-acyltransferase [Nocardioidaceae bacterium]